MKGVALFTFAADGPGAREWKAFHADSGAALYAIDAAVWSPDAAFRHLMREYARVAFLRVNERLIADPTRYSCLREYFDAHVTATPIAASAYDACDLESVPVRVKEGDRIVIAGVPLEWHDDAYRVKGGTFTVDPDPDLHLIRLKGKP